MHNWTARLWASALAFLCIPLVFAFCRRIGYSAQTSLVAAALLAINPYFAIVGQLNLLDQGFSFFLSAAVFAFVLAQRERVAADRSRTWMLITWAALGLAVLSKGIVALVLAGATLAVYIAVTRDLALLRRLQLSAGATLFLVITVPWFWLVQQRNPEFFHFFFVREHFERFLTTVHDRVEPFWYFAPILLVALLPVIGNWRSWRLAKIEGARVSGEFRAELFLLIWCLVVFVLFSLSQSKLASYLLPLMPPLAVVLARVTHSERLAFRRAKWLSVSFLLLIAGALVVAGWRRDGSISQLALGYAVAVGVLCIGHLIFDRTDRERSVARSWGVLAALSVACYQLLALCYAATYPARSAEALAAQFDGQITANTKLYSVGQYRHSLSFYLRRPLAVYDFLGELEFGIHQAGLTVADQDLAKFLEHWRQDTHAIAFIDPRIYPELSTAGMPGRIVARDADSIVVARS
jgi:4-amino-4-deoxy-L-arabinose transferase-like glycosyltransferase